MVQSEGMAPLTDPRPQSVQFFPDLCRKTIAELSIELFDPRNPLAPPVLVDGEHGLHRRVRDVQSIRIERSL